MSRSQFRTRFPPGAKYTLMSPGIKPGTVRQAQTGAGPTTTSRQRAQRSVAQQGQSMVFSAHGTRPPPQGQGTVSAGVSRVAHSTGRATASS